MSKKLIYLVSFVLVLGLATGVATAESIPIRNFGFEEPNTIKQSCWDGEKADSKDVPGWTDGPATAHDSGVASEWTGYTEGMWSGFLENADTAVWNLVNHIISSGEQFTLQVYLQDNWKSGGTCLTEFSIYYDVNGTRVTVESNTVTPPGGAPNGWTEYSLNFAADDDLNSVGHQLGIEINNVTDVAYASWIGMDDVRLTCPAIWKAWNPNPTIDSTIASSAVVLQWNAGKYAASTNGHRVYLDPCEAKVQARSDCDVNGVIRTEPNYPASGLTSGGTYYWAIDEVNDPCVWPGNIWSFHVQVKKAYNPTPADGAQRVIREIELLEWEPGADAQSHHVYFGTKFNDVNAGTGGTDKGTRIEPNWPITPSPLEPNTTYFWRIDEFDGITTHKGDIWRFTTTLVGLGAITRELYTDIPGGSVTDLTSNPKYPDYPDQVDRIQVFEFWNLMDFYGSRTHGWLWPPADGDYTFWLTVADTGELWLSTDETTQNVVLIATGGQQSEPIPLQGDKGYYIMVLHKEVEGMDGVTVAWQGPTIPTQTVITGGYLQPYESLRAYNPYPANGATGVERMPILSWTAGDKAKSHKVYFDPNEQKVIARSGCDVNGVSRNEPNYPITTLLDLDTTYFWAVDEVNDPCVWPGNVWNFTVADYLVVDDFESYNPNLADVWKSGGKAMIGLSAAAHESTQAMAIDYNNTPSPYYSEAYADANGPNSLNFGTNWLVEGVKALSLWFQGYPDVRGSFSYSGTDPLGPYTATITADGADIWSTSDQFHYAYKQLSDTGYIQARVDSVENTHASAKAGLMIRDTLDPGSKYGLVAVTPGSGVIFEHRDVEDDNSVQEAAVTGITAPHWIRLTRWWDGSYYYLRAEHANDVSGSCAEDWEQIGTDLLASFEQGWDYEVYIGLCVTSHNTGQLCDANFSSVTLTPLEGSISGAWQSQDIGTAYNAPEPMYVILQDKDSNGIVYHPDPNVTQTAAWTEWRIDLNDFHVQGVNLTDVNKIYIGFGDGAPGSGSGTVYIDDIRLYPPQFVPGKLPQIPADLVYNGVINEEDLGVITNNWLISDYNVTPVPVSDTDPNCVGWWKLDDGSGNTANDSSIYDNDGNLIGGPLWVAGRIGSGALDFNGVTAYVDCGNDVSLDITDKITLSVWVKTDDSGNGQHNPYVAKGDHSYAIKHRTDNNIEFFIYDMNDWYSAVFSVDSSFNGVWHHLAGTYDGSQVKLYVDGESVAPTTHTGAIASSTFPVNIGRDAENTDRLYDGLIDDVRIYNRALSQGEVAYLAGKPAGIPFRQPLELLLTPADPNINLYNADGKIDFRDFAEFGKSWYYQQVWPTW